MCIGRFDSSPNEPAASKPANERKPTLAAKTTVESPTPSGSRTKSPEKPSPCGASPVASFAKITTTSARISTTAASSTASSERVVVRTFRVASSPITAQPASANGHQGGESAIPVWRRNACEKTAMPRIDTAGKTM